jgi:hypothetical protein
VLFGHNISIIGCGFPTTCQLFRGQPPDALLSMARWSDISGMTGPGPLRPSPRIGKSGSYRGETGSSRIRRARGVVVTGISHAASRARYLKYGTIPRFTAEFSVGCPARRRCNLIVKKSRKDREEKTKCWFRPPCRAVTRLSLLGRYSPNKAARKRERASMGSKMR